MKDYVQICVRVGNGSIANTYFVFCSFLLLNATFVHNGILRLGILNLC